MCEDGLGGVGIVQGEGACIQSPPCKSTSYAGPHESGDEAEAKLESTSLHLPHLLLHLVEVKVQHVVLPDSKVLDNPHIDGAACSNLAKSFDKDELLGLLHSPALESSLRDDHLDRLSEA